MTTLCLSRKQYRYVDSINMSYCCQLFFKNRPQSSGEFKINALKFPKKMNFYLAMIFFKILIIYSPFLIEIFKLLHGFFDQSHV
jgi:hypothetical protein